MKILVVSNLSYPIKDEVYKNYFSSFNVPIELTYFQTNIPITHKSFGMFGGKELWGLDGIKEKLRQILPSEYDGAFHQIHFVYEIDPAMESKIAAWTYPQPLLYAPFCEMPCNQLWNDTQTLVLMHTHETIHAFHRQLWSKNIVTKDDLDLYDEEYDLYAPSGNRKRNMERILPYKALIEADTVRTSTMKIIEALQKLIASFFAKKPSIKDMALAIQEYEGYFPPSPKYPNGSISWRNDNPGNLRYSPFESFNQGGFSVFDTYEDGFNALVHQITIARDGRSSVYKPTDTLVEFFHKYAPSSDNNEPSAYAVFIAKKLGVSPQFIIKDLV